MGDEENNNPDGRNILIFSNGTGQDGGVRPDQRMSNIYKLFRPARVSPDTAIDPSRQLVFYDPGLGTDADARGFTALKRFIVKLLSSVTGRGITINIADCDAGAARAQRDCAIDEAGARTSGLQQAT
jgi:uncharacterized protein (DUF2235 family)